MNKQKKLKRLVILNAIFCIGILFAFGVVCWFTVSMVDSSAEEKTQAENALNGDQTKISSLNGQLQSSTIADQHYILIQQQRTSLNFLSETEGLKFCLRNAKSVYRLSNSLKLSLTQEKASDKAELANANYEVVEHPNMKVEFSAMSDTHLFAFLNELQRNCPGFVRLDTLRIKRTSDLDANTITQMQSGAAPFTVDAAVEFNWIGLVEKTKPSASAPNSAEGK